MRTSSADTLGNRVFNHLRDAILEGTLRPGDPLSEREIAATTKVSRVPVREALIRLEAKGLVSLVKDRGGIVRTFGIEEIRHLYEVRECLEGMAARLAAGRIDRDQLRKFERSLKSFRRGSDAAELAKLRRVNEQLHEAISQSCGNPILQRALSDIRGQITLSRTWAHSRFSDEDVMHRVQDHLAIVRALLQGDGAKAEEHMRAHIARWKTIKL